jgi:hypothetical protein
VWQNNVEVTDIYDKESETSTVGGVEISFNWMGEVCQKSI